MKGRSQGTGRPPKSAVRPKKALGQHFLTDQGVAQAMWISGTTSTRPVFATVPVIPSPNR